MHKNAVASARSLLEERPPRDPDSIQNYISQLKTARSDLKAYMGGARKLGDQDYLEAGPMLELMDENILMAEQVLKRVLEEVDQDKMNVHANGNEPEIDIPDTVERFAHNVALDTLGMSHMDRVMASFREYDLQVDPLIPEGYKEFPREKFAERLQELISLSPERLTEKVAKEFPTDEWIGAQPEPPVDHIPSHAETDKDPKPEKDGVDGEFEDDFDAERRFRGIPKNKETRTQESSYKTAQEPHINQYDGGPNYGVGQPGPGGVADFDDVSDYLTSTFPSLMSALAEASEEDPDGIAALEHELVRITRDYLEGTDPDYNDPDYEGLYEADMNEAENMVRDRSYRSYSGLGIKRASRRKRAVEDPSSTGFAGKPGDDPAPDPEEGVDSRFFSDNANEGNSGAPRGPNRRRGEDVPAYSTPSSKLTAALKLAEQYENMDAETALRIVERVEASLKESGELPDALKKHMKEPKGEETKEDAADGDPDDDGSKDDKDDKSDKDKSDDKPDFLKKKDDKDE